MLFTELFIAGYPPEDLVLKPAFLRACERAADALVADTADGGPGIIVGTPLKRNERHPQFDRRSPTAARLLAERYKLDLPNYGEFDEKRVFQAGPDMPGPINFRGVRLGIPICEDIWGDLGVCETLAESGAEILLVPNGSPYYRGKVDVRHQVVIRQVIESGLPILYANQLGGQDELVFDGASFAINADKSLAFQMSEFEEAVTVTDVEARRPDGWACTDGPMSNIPEKEEADYRACMLGLRDYVNKNGFQERRAGPLGRHRFGDLRRTCRRCARRGAGARRDDAIPLHLEGFAGRRRSLRPRARLPLRDRADLRAGRRLFACADAVVRRHQRGITEENLQSRARGTILMAISNKFGSMVVTTGNKSEMSVGYATLYGDMNGGFNPIKDLYKMQVYALSRWRNDQRSARRARAVRRSDPAKRSSTRRRRRN